MDRAIAVVLPSHNNRHPTIPKRVVASSSATAVSSAKAASNAKAISSNAIPVSAITVTTDDAAAISADAADNASRTDHAEVAAGQEQSRHRAHRSRR
jgi:hypothetical protein